MLSIHAENQTSVRLMDVLAKDPQKMAALMSIGPCFLILGGVWALYLLRKDLFPEKSVAFMILAGFSFSVTSVSMHTLNKAVASFTEMPSTVTCIQMVFAGVVLMGVDYRQVLQAPRGQMLRWCIVPFTYAAMLNSSLYGYQYISLTLMTVFRNLAPLATMAVETVIMEPEHRPSMSAPILCSIGVMVIGALLFSWKDEAFSWIGVGLVLLNTFLAILDRVLQRRLLVQECKDLQSSTCMVINNSLGLVPSLIMMIATHELEGFRQHTLVWHDPGFIALVIMSAFMGLFIGVTGILCQRAMTATSFQVLQNASKVAVVFLAVHVFGDDMGSYSHKVGMFLSIAGSLAYGYVRAIESSKASAMDAKNGQDCETAENEPIQNAEKTYEACKA